MMIWEVSWRQTTHQTSCNLTARMRSTVYCPMRSSVTTVGKRGREISPSCFCHSQLIPSCPPPLHASSFLAAHRIWLRPSVFSTMMFSRQSDQTLPKTLATPFEHFLPPLSLAVLLRLSHLFLYNKKKGRKNIKLDVLWEVFMSAVTGCVVTERGVSVQSENRHVKSPYLSLYYPVPPPLRECWLFYQHPNVEFWSNSLCVPNIAAGLSGDVFMTRTLTAACRGKMFICGIWFALATPRSVAAALCCRHEAALWYLSKANRQNESTGQLSEQPILYPLIVWRTVALFSRQSHAFVS